MKEARVERTGGELSLVRKLLRPDRTERRAHCGTQKPHIDYCIVFE
jgi:hypothetical protein